MNAEIIITGLCAVLNARDSNETMPEPSVILVRTDEHDPSEHAGQKKKEGGTAPEKHIPFIAFDSKTMRVTGSSKFRKVPKLPNFRFLVLDGVEIELRGLRLGKLIVKKSYKNVVCKDKYWPEVKNEWDRNYVPKRGEKPKAMAVAAFLRFGAGMITAGRRTKVDWKFEKNGKTVHRGKFAMEVLYRKIPVVRNEIVLGLRDLENGCELDVLRFSAIGKAPLQIFIGNNTAASMRFALSRTTEAAKGVGHHLKFINKVAGSSPGPIPVPIKSGGLIGNEKPVAGDESGYCGPVNPNGGG